MLQGQRLLLRIASSIQMKSIGVNQWAGVDPWFAEMVSDLQQHAARTRRAENDRWNRMSPSDKFFRLADDRFQIPRLFGIAPVRSFWRIGGVDAGRNQPYVA